MNAQGADVIHFDPVEVKQGFIAPTELRRKEVPRILHPKPTQLYEVYLREHRVVLLNHLGRNRQHEPANLPAGVFTLFPSFWPESRDITFYNSTFHPVLGCGERKVRSLMEKAFTPDILQHHNIDPVALSQAFGHSKEVGDKHYKYGLKNSINSAHGQLLR